MCRLQSKQNMMASSNKSACCLLLLIILIHQTASFSVEKLCATRCLYGRGGVLCHCNAMHFTGKRSGPAQHYYNSMSDSNEFGSLTEENPGKAHADVDLAGSPYIFNDNGNDILDESWDGRKLDDFVSGLERSSNILKNMDGVEQSNQDDRQTSRRLPLVQLNPTQEEDPDETMARSNAASKVNQLMGAPYLAEELGFENDHKSENVKANPKVKEHFRRLQGILNQALQGR